MHKGTFPRAAVRARKRTLVHHRAETLRAEKIGELSDPAPENVFETFAVKKKQFPTGRNHPFIQKVVPGKGLSSFYRLLAFDVHCPVHNLLPDVFVSVARRKRGRYAAITSV